LTANAQAAVDRVLAGYESYKHYFAREIFYSGTQNGPHVVVYLSNDPVVVTGARSVSIGSGVRVEYYTNMTANNSASRYQVFSQAGGNIVWGIQDFILSDANPTMIGGVLVDLPASFHRAQFRADAASAFAASANMLLAVFVLIALFWNIFRRR